MLGIVNVDGISTNLDAAIFSDSRIDKCSSVSKGLIQSFFLLTSSVA